MSDESFNGWLEGWSARGRARWDHSWTAQRRTSGPRHRSTNQLGRAICGNVFLLAPGPSVLARQTVTATRQLVCLVATTVGRHRCWGAHSISFGLAPTIRTHCVRRWGQRPELLGHKFWPRRTGRWHRAEGLSRWTPTGWVAIGRSQMEGAPCEGTWHVRGSFYWTLTV